MLYGTNLNQTPYPWLSDSNVTNAWIAEKEYLTISTSGVQSGTGVTTWAPHKGTISLVQASDGYQPTVTSWGTNQKNCLLWDGVDDKMTGDALGALISGTNMPWSMTIAVSAETVNSIKEIISFSGTSDTQNFHVLALDSGKFAVLRAGNSGSTLTQSVTSTNCIPIAGNCVVITIIYDGNNLTIRLNGVTTNVSSASQSTVAATISKFTVGCFRGASTGVNFSNIKVRCITFGATAWSSSTYTKIENYLMLELKTYACGKGLPAQTFPFNTTMDGLPFGRELSGDVEVAEIGGLVDNQTNPVGWYYTYNPTTDIATRSQFIPMIYNRSYLSQLSSAAQYGTIIGYNEPDLSTQANVTVAQALIDWPLFEATGCRLGSPACATDMSANGNWFQLFMSGNGGGYLPRVDFICIHSYAALFTDPTGAGLLSYIDAVYQKWKKPIWVTEWGMINFVSADPTTWTYPSSAQAQAYIANVIPSLKSRSYVERFSWYPNVYASATISGSTANAGNVPLGNPDGTLTTLGALYASL